jgi:hypothetical protein
MLNLELEVAKTNAANVLYASIVKGTPPHLHLQDRNSLSRSLSSSLSLGHA